MEDLKELVINSLDSNGVLDTIRAQLRSSVFSAIQSQQNKVALKTSEAEKISETQEGRIATELFKDFLETGGINYSHSVFLQEAKVNDSVDTKSLSQQLGLESKSEVPLIFSLIDTFKRKTTKSPPKQKLQLESPKQFLSPDKSKKFPEEAKFLPKQSSKEEEVPKEDKEPQEKPQKKKPELPPLEPKGRVRHWQAPEEPPKENKIPPLKNIPSQDSNDSDQAYTDDFEEIDEEIEVEEEEIDTGGRESMGIGESVGSSMGVDASVDSMALEEYDVVENVKRLR